MKQRERERDSVEFERRERSGKGEKVVMLVLGRVESNVNFVYLSLLRTGKGCQCDVVCLHWFVVFRQQKEYRRKNFMPKMHLAKRD